jgi:hypothetical protein
MVPTVSERYRLNASCVFRTNENAADDDDSARTSLHESHNPEELAPPNQIGQLTTRHQRNNTLGATVCFELASSCGCDHHAVSNNRAERLNKSEVLSLHEGRKRAGVLSEMPRLCLRAGDKRASGPWWSSGQRGDVAMERI